MSDIAISVEHLGKQYRIGKREPYRALRDVITEGVAAPFRRLASFGRNASNGHANGADAPDTFWALKDVSFVVRRGEVLGIIGRNGAGKSTLLKILSRITEPTEGRVRLYGRVGSLLEVGTGFHPELTGRENIYLNGAILGMKRTDIIRQFDEIVAFAEVEQFIDTPVKHYSSGMYVRLAFAVAAHLEPDILVVDEVLAVGDAAFQKKCLGKMGEAARGGRTVLFVSHNITAIRSLCQSAVLLQNGSVLANRDVNSVTSEYLSSASQTLLERNWNSPQSGRGTNDFRIKSIELHPNSTESKTQIFVDTPFDIRLHTWILIGTVLNVTLRLKSAAGEIIFASPSGLVECKPGIATFVCHIPGNLMNDGVHLIDLLFVDESLRLCFALEDALSFEIHDLPSKLNWFGKRPGYVRPHLDWHYCWSAE